MGEVCGGLCHRHPPDRGKRVTSPGSGRDGSLAWSVVHRKRRKGRAPQGDASPCTGCCPGRRHHSGGLCRARHRVGRGTRVRGRDGARQHPDIHRALCGGRLDFDVLPRARHSPAAVAAARHGSSNGARRRGLRRRHDRWRTGAAPAAGRRVYRRGRRGPRSCDHPFHVSLRFEVHGSTAHGCTSDAPVTRPRVFRGVGDAEEMAARPGIPVREVPCARSRTEPPDLAQDSQQTGQDVPPAGRHAHRRELGRHDRGDPRHRSGHRRSGRTTRLLHGHRFQRPRFRYRSRRGQGDRRNVDRPNDSGMDLSAFRLGRFFDGTPIRPQTSV